MAAVKIKMYRTIKGLTQEDMAAKLNMSQSVYSRIESNHSEPNISILKKIAEVLEVNLQDIMEDIPFVINNHQNQNAMYEKNEFYCKTDKNLYERIISDKDIEIMTYRAQITHFLVIIEEFSRTKNL